MLERWLDDEDPPPPLPNFEVDSTLLPLLILAFGLVLGRELLAFLPL